MSTIKGGGIIGGHGPGVAQSRVNSRIEVQGPGELLITGGRGPAGGLEFGGLYVTASATTDLVEGVWVAANLATSLFTQNKNFTNGSSRLTYTGNRDISILASYSFCLSSTTHQEIHLSLYKNGSQLVGSSSHVNTANSGRTTAVGSNFAVDISNGDHLEVWMNNATSSNDATVEEGTFVLREI